MAPGIPDTGIKMGPMIIPSINHTDRPNPIAGGRHQGPLPRRSRRAPHLRRRRSGRLSRPCQNRMPARPDHDLRFFRWRQPVRALEEGKPALQTSRPTGRRARFGSAVASGGFVAFNRGTRLRRRWRGGVPPAGTAGSLDFGTTRQRVSVGKPEKTWLSHFGGHLKPGEWPALPASAPPANSVRQVSLRPVKFRHLRLHDPSVHRSPKAEPSDLGMDRALESALARGATGWRPCGCQRSRATRLASRPRS